MRSGFLLSSAIPYRRQLSLIGLLTICASFATLAIPWLAGRLLGGVLDLRSGPISSIIVPLIGALATMTAFNILSQIVSAATSARILADLRLTIYTHVQKLPMAFHDRSRQGDLLALMTYEVSNLSSFLTGTLATLPAMLLTAGGAVVLLFLIDVRLALFLPLLVPAFYVGLRLVGRRLRTTGRRLRKAEAAMMSIAESDLEMLPAIRAFAVEEQQGRAYAAAIEEARSLLVRQTRISAAIGPTIGLIAACSAITLLVLVGRDVGAGEKSPAELFSFLLYAALLTRPVGALAEFYGRYQIASGTLSRLQAVMRERAEPGLQCAGLTSRARGEIVLDAVTFAYPGREPILRGANLTIQPGEIIAVTGENGAGKSTIINLLLRFYNPASGCITIDGDDISGLQVQDLRRQIGLVPQRALLFNGTVRENITFGFADASDAQIRSALDLSQASLFIPDLPQGLETQIGDHGVRLSGGQRQRLALARALIKDPPILIFDEATSMYDLEGEAAFVEACQTALQGRTVILITHRPASLALADRIVIVEDGIIRDAYSDAAPTG